MMIKVDGDEQGDGEGILKAAAYCVAVKLIFYHYKRKVVLKKSLLVLLQSFQVLVYTILIYSMIYHVYVIYIHGGNINTYSINYATT